MYLANKLFLRQVESSNSQTLLIGQTEQLVGMAGRNQTTGLGQPRLITCTV